MYKRKVILGVMAAVSLAIGAGLSFLTEQQAVMLFALPFAPIAAGLRRLSLLGGFWNVLAWALYGCLSLLPAVWLLWRVKNKRAKGCDGLLGLLSLLLFWALYWMINPDLTGRFFGKLVAFAPALLGVCLWAVLLCYGILQLCAAVGQSKNEGLHRWLTGLVWCVIAVFFLDLLAVELSRTVPELKNGNGLMILNYLAALVTDLIGLRTALYALTLTERLEQGWYTEKTIQAAGDLADVCGEAIVVTAVTGMLFTLMQVLMSSAVDQLNVSLDLPVFQLLFLLCVLLLSRMIARGKALQDDSDSII